jgi:hypothetical protein
MAQKYIFIAIPLFCNIVRQNVSCDKAFMRRNFLVFKLFKAGVGNSFWLSGQKRKKNGF